MPSYIEYEIWKYNKFVGKFYSFFPLIGQFVALPEVPVFKQSYYKKSKEIKVPLKSLVVYSDYTTIVTKIVLDVSKKSPRQIEIIKQCRHI